MESLGRHILSRKLERWLEPGEYAYYLDGNPQNTNPDNLALSPLPELVKSLNKRQVELVCPYCGEVFRVSKSHKERRVHCNNRCRSLNSRKFEVDREELEQLVWQMPTTEVALLFGVSDKAVEKRCKLLEIQNDPTPRFVGVGQDAQQDRHHEYIGIPQDALAKKFDGISQVVCGHFQVKLLVVIGLDCAHCCLPIIQLSLLPKR